MPPKDGRQENEISLRILIRYTKTGEGTGKRHTLTPHHPILHHGPALKLSLALQDEVLVDDPSLTQIFDPASLGSDEVRQIAIKAEM